MAKSKFFNRVAFQTATVGAGSVAVGASVNASLLVPAQAGVQDGDAPIPYLIEDGDDFELGLGTYNSAGPTFARDTVLLSKAGAVIGTAKLALDGVATVRFIEDAATLSAIQDAPGPSFGVDSVIRYNKQEIAEDLTLWEDTNVFAVDTGADTLNVGKAQGYSDGDKVRISTTGTAPAGLAIETDFWVVGVSLATLQLAATRGGGAINITGAGTGVHTLYEPINANSAGTITVASGSTVTVPSGSKWAISS